jgi:hypothetical protein
MDDISLTRRASLWFKTGNESRQGFEVLALVTSKFGDDVPLRFNVGEEI